MKVQLLRQYTIISVAVFGIAIILLAAVHFNQANRQVIADAERRNLAIAQFIINDLIDRMPEHFQHSHTPDKATDSRHQVHLDQVDAVLATVLQDLPVLKIQVFERDLTIYSTERSQVGEIKSTPRFLETRSTWQPLSELSHKKSFNAFDGVVMDRDIVETYIPIGGKLSPDAHSLILEIYTDVTDVIADVRQAQWGLLMILSGLFIVSNLILYLVVRRSNSMLVEQQN